jgi:hypothetical protein
MLCMVPITNAALGTLPPQRLKNASGLFNLTRNLGGAVALALINTAMNGHCLRSAPTPMTRLYPSSPELCASRRR